MSDRHLRACAASNPRCGCRLSSPCFPCDKFLDVAHHIVKILILCRCPLGDIARHHVDAAIGVAACITSNVKDLHEDLDGDWRQLPIAAGVKLLQLSLAALKAPAGADPFFVLSYPKLEFTPSMVSLMSRRQALYFDGILEINDLDRCSFCIV